MRAVVQFVVVVLMVAMTVAWGSTGIDPVASTRPIGPVVQEISPAQGEVVGVAHPVVMTLRGPITDRRAAERALTVTSTPAMTGSYEWLDATTVQWVPASYWPAHSTVTLSLAGKHTEFQTGPAVVGVADISEHTFTVTIDGIPTDSTMRMPAPHHLPHAGEEGVLLATMGRPEYPTPPGSYTVLEKMRTVTMDSSSVGIPIDDPDGYLLEVDYAVRFTRRGLFVHSAPWAVPSIGFDNVSHGCVSLMPAAAEWYFNTATVGDPIIVQE